MKLSRQNEMIVSAVLIGVLVFYPTVLTPFVAPSLGKLAAFALVYYVWRHMSKMVAFFLAIAILRASHMLEFNTDLGSMSADDKAKLKAALDATSTPPSVTSSKSTDVAKVSSDDGVNDSKTVSAGSTKSTAAPVS